MANARDFRFCTRVGHVKSSSSDEWVLPKWAWSGSREQFLHCELRKFRHSKSSVYRWYTQFDGRRFVYDTWDNGSRLGRVMVECTLSITHCLRLNLQLHTISFVRTCRISSFCTVASQLARLPLTRRIARALGDSWASCYITWLHAYVCVIKEWNILQSFYCLMSTNVTYQFMHDYIVKSSIASKIAHKAMRKAMHINTFTSKNTKACTIMSTKFTSNTL